jgi:hypothetical protein
LYALFPLYGTMRNCRPELAGIRAVPEIGHQR